MTEPGSRSAHGPLAGVRVLDLSRVLAGPSAAQLLGDLGADVLKIERPGSGDDTRGWGPPFVRGEDGRERESAYYLCANRNKRSVTIDLGAREGAAIVGRLAEECDVLVENFKAGALDRLGLGYEELAQSSPGLVYCSITGFGHTGPRADQGGYDFLIQAMGGIMSLTGEPAGRPMKVGVAVVDVITGLYAAVAILAALRHRDRTGRGQHIDLALYDVELAALVNAGASYLVSGTPPGRHGNAHPHIVPYQTFASCDGEIALAVGNDEQFARLTELVGDEELLADVRFGTNAGRVRHRELLIPRLEEHFAKRPSAFWVEALRERGVPCGPVHDLAQAFDDPQTHARAMRITLDHPHAEGGAVELTASPMRLGETPVSYRRRPPELGEHTAEVLREVLGMSEAAIAGLRERGVI